MKVGNIKKFRGVSGIVLGAVALSITLGISGSALGASDGGGESVDEAVAIDAPATPTVDIPAPDVPELDAPLPPAEDPVPPADDPCAALTPEQLAEIQSTFDNYGHLLNLTLEQACQGYFDMFVAPGPVDPGGEVDFYCPVGEPACGGR